MDNRVVLLTETGLWGELAAAALQAWGARFDHVPWSWGEDKTVLSRTFDRVDGDDVICFKADCIVPAVVLARARRAINFHPGPPWWRGVACPERALARQDRVYGVTAHHMLKEVDLGPILDVSTFAIAHTDTPASLRQRVGVAMLHQLERVWFDWPRIPESSGKPDPIWDGELLTASEARRRGFL